MKKVALFFTFLLLGTTGAFAQSSKYDLNGDGNVNVTDVIELVGIILGNRHEAIDLGLPSGTKWASCNVGATTPEEYGGFYAWGETEVKEIYGEYNYKFFQNGSYVNIGSDISGTENDVAHVKWSGEWCMPTLDDINELVNNSNAEWTTVNDVSGRKFTSKTNGNSIFLPHVGCRWYGDHVLAGSWGTYWTSTYNPDKSSNAYSLDVGTQAAGWGDGDRYSGRCVRPVVRN